MLEENHESTWNPWSHVFSNICSSHVLPILSSKWINFFWSPRSQPALNRSRHKVNPEDQTIFTYSNSLRLLANQSGLGEESNIEIFVQREEENHGSSRFSIGSSFRKLEKMLLRKKNCLSNKEQRRKWSNVSSSDLMFLNSEMLNATSSDRFNNFEANVDLVPNTRGVVENEQIMNIKEEMERKLSFERASENRSMSESQLSLDLEI
ncbi:hypothetical protein SESBI_47320 [Sesbania bispinosa]|nr:hypothetical protein SESBI_47320 [Sesbania bispinosa]